jgi:transcriptional regulator with XRE-family HTH domain
MPKKRTLTPGASPLHHFGSEVRRAREAAGMTLTELGALVPCDNSTVSRIESGLIAPDAHFAEVCDVTFSEMRGWFTRFYTDSQGWGAAFPPALREFAAYEAEAVALWTFEHSLIPGLLQTEAYARAVLSRHPHVTADQVTERVAARMARQSVLDRYDPPVFWVLIDESVLHREVGDAKVMADQLGRLAAAADQPTVTVQLVSRAGAHVGLLGAFVLAETADAHVAYLDHIADGVTTDSPAIVGQVSTRFDVLRTEAFKGSESRTMIEAAAESWNNA